jgi:hypothetical protein
MQHRAPTRRRGIAVSITMVVATTLIAACAAGPINVGTLPISGSSIMSVHVQACAPRAGALRITTDHHQVDPDRMQLEVSRWAPSDGPVQVTSWAEDGRHWEFTTAPVAAGDCLHFFLNTVSMCCDPVEPALTFGFDYRIEYLD